MAAIVLCTINAKWIHPSLALRLLRANLPPDLNTDKNCIIVEFALRQRPEEKTAALLAAKPKILALSVSIWNHKATLELLQSLEIEWTKNGEKPVIVLGGPEITGLLADTAKRPAAGNNGDPVIFQYADFVIGGEGELVFAELCRDILSCPEEAKKRHAKFITADAVDIAAVKTAYDLYTGMDLRQKLIYVESSRGCPYFCAFCQSAVKRGQGSAVPAVREFPVEGFLENLEKLLQRSVIVHDAAKTRTIKFLDRSFNVNIPRALRILEFCLAKTNTAENELQFHFEMVPGVFPSALQNMLALFPPGSIRLETGIQSFNPKTCSTINRISSPEKELETLRFLREKTNAILHADLIAGLPGEDLASFGRGFDLLWLALGSKNAGHAPFEIQPGILKILPGTPMETMAQDGRFPVMYSKNPPYEVIETDCLSVNDMEKIKNFARFWETIVNRRAFPDLLPLAAPQGKPVFAHFMELSQKLLEHFGKNWGIPKDEMEEALQSQCNSCNSCKGNV